MSCNEYINQLEDNKLQVVKRNGLFWNGMEKYRTQHDSLFSTKRLDEHFSNAWWLIQWKIHAGRHGGAVYRSTPRWQLPTCCLRSDRWTNGSAELFSTHVHVSSGKLVFCLYLRLKRLHVACSLHSKSWAWCIHPVFATNFLFTSNSDRKWEDFLEHIF